MGSEWFTTPPHEVKDVYRPSTQGEEMKLGWSSDGIQGREETCVLLRKPTVKLQLQVAHHWLGTGGHYHSVADMHGISKASVCRAVHNFVGAVIDEIFRQFVKWPKNVEDIVNKFYRSGGMLMVCGSVDGILIDIDVPKEYEPTFVDRHGNHSINCMVVSRGGAAARALAFHPGEPGSIPGGVIPEPSHVLDNATGWRVFSRISSFLRPLHSGAGPYSSRFTFIGSRDPDVNSRPNLFTPRIRNKLLHRGLQVARKQNNQTEFPSSECVDREETALISAGAGALQLLSQDGLPGQKEGFRRVHATVNKLQEWLVALYPALCSPISSSSPSCSRSRSREAGAIAGTVVSAGKVWVEINIRVLRTFEGEARRVRSGAGLQRRGKLEIKKSRRPAASSGTIVTWGIEQEKGNKIIHS
ncbi:hypothetical protein PR048_032673 [Dryococelus australis]|uniref:Harbinger transposase-derived nuclease n=1 Tax=Dryococelus australis TaxID=614101 RepID=A0ABQ9G2V8_9NEOP|nr:hypothetical protein PR048_032673 [Dryococelus australis]